MNWPKGNSLREGGRLVPGHFGLNHKNFQRNHLAKSKLYNYAIIGPVVHFTSSLIFVDFLICMHFDGFGQIQNN